ncbi:MAG TPA: hypothetical protein VKU00_24965 [Chthonomonadaceae bacterium]|nr:hypothetical protein [Chthonomonadaceae bacterium]
MADKDTTKTLDPSDTGTSKESSGKKMECIPADPAYAHCKTPLAKKLMEIRARALANGMKPNTTEEIDKEIAEMRRDRNAEDTNLR